MTEQNLAQEMHALSQQSLNAYLQLEWEQCLEEIKNRANNGYFSAFFPNICPEFVTRLTDSGFHVGTADMSLNHLDDMHIARLGNWEFDVNVEENDVADVWVVTWGECKWQKEMKFYLTALASQEP